MYGKKFFHSQEEGFKFKSQENLSDKIPTIESTIIKKPYEKVQSTFETPKPQRKIMLFNQKRQKILFPLVKDNDVGINQKYQNVTIHALQDDDRQTSSTQLKGAMIRTIDDLYQVLGDSSASSSYYTQHY